MATATATKLKIKPLGARVVIKPLKLEEMTKSGIVLPDTVKEKPQEGRVVATGPGGFDKNGNKVEITLKEGDRVLFQKYSGTEIKFEDEEYVVIPQEEILAVVEG